MISPGLPATAKPWFWRRDRDPAGAQVLDRVVGAAVAERELERLQARGAREQLVAEADAEHRLGGQQRADVVDDVVQRRRVARAGDEEEAVGVGGQQLLGGASCTGRISSVAPREVKLRMIERLIPVSSATIRGPPPSPA